MAAPFQRLRPLGCQSMVRCLKEQLPPRRWLSTTRQKIPFPENMPEKYLSQIPMRYRDKPKKEIKVYEPPPPAKSLCKDPLAAFTADQLAILDPTGERKALFDYKNRQGVKVGDILRVTFKSGDPFNGVCINIRNRGLDSAFLLRNQLTRVGCEMWVKVFNPNVQSVEIVQRTEKRKRRKRLTYMRKPEHDRGSVEGIVQNYLRERAVLTGNSDPNRSR